MPEQRNGDHPSLTGNVLEADIVIAVGRGLKKKEYFEMAAELADRFGAQIVGTRSALDLGWLPPAREVGLSGLRIAPELYLSFGVSGANFHTIGMHRSKYIIAVNTDKKAAIFQLADIVIIEKAEIVLAELLDNAKQRAFRETENAKTFLIEWMKNYSQIETE